MIGFLKSVAAAGIVVSSFVALPQPASIAGGRSVDQGQAIVTQLGPHAHAVTYWIADPQGWEVVTTIDPLAGDETEADGRAIVRFSSRLLPGEWQTISVPAAVGEQQPTLLIRRLADRIEVTAGR